MRPLKTILANAARSDKRIVLSEGEDPRAIAAAVMARKEKAATIVLVGSESKITPQLHSLGGSTEGIEIIDPVSSSLRDTLAQDYYELRKHRGLTEAQASQEVTKPHIFAALLVKKGLADGTVGGAVETTSNIVRAAIQIIGLAPDHDFVSSFFLMLLCKDSHTKKGAFAFSDAGLVIDPTAEQMAAIACATAQSYQQLVNSTPRVAMLSFSTYGSAKHAAVTKVATATKLAQEKAPDMLIDGELQFDAAFVPEVAQAKAPNSPLGGDANIFIFPNLESGNIAYKIAQRLGGAVAIGPILQGLAHPANDLSRGCNAEDILHMIAVTAVQAESQG